MSKQTRRIVAFMLAVIYITASLFSSLSILLCDHHHHYHAHHTAVDLLSDHTACDCGHHHDNHDHNIPTDEAESVITSLCDHHHTMLGERDAATVANKRSIDDNLLLRTSLLYASYAVSTPIYETESLYYIDLHRIYGDEAEPLRAAFISRESLRAPPALA